MNKKKIYQKPTYQIIKVRSMFSLLAGSYADEDEKDPGEVPDHETPGLNDTDD